MNDFTKNKSIKHKLSGGSACLDRNPESISEALPGII